LWEENDLRPKSSLVKEIYPSYLPPEPPNDQRFRERSKSSQGIVRQVHPHVGQNRIEQIFESLLILKENRGAGRDFFKDLL
jgi:hypothetical protein